ncbi:TBC1 domain family member 7 [Microplitis mediator]|uniref:TBC1 domain family member 7 n=1 Tax=Microplitis mediator TaxID=375433 RepID=UPI0025541DF8|nr:TBC1 domain family member 7 [Microplitis mediator]
MADERNFRSSYYEKVGFRSVEEKKSLEILLKEQPFDKAKLKQFCLRFTVPAIYRNFLWKILLDVTPIYTGSNDFVASQRRDEFHDLRKALRVTKIVDENSKPHQTLLIMWLLRTRRAKLDINAQLESSLFRAMSRMAESLWHIMEGDHEYEKIIDIYWLLCGFLDHVDKFYNDVGRLIDCTSALLEKEDSCLYKHLLKCEVLNNIPFDQWFCSCFAETICDGSLPKIWDKIAVGAYKILAFVAAVVFITLRRFLLNCDSTDCVLDTISHINEETSEMIVNKAIELWQQSGSALVTMSPNTNIINSTSNA